MIVHRDGALTSRSLRFPVWLLRALIAVAIAITILIVLGAAFYGPLIRSAVRVPFLERRVAALEAENRRVIELATALERAEQRYAQIRGVLGADIVPALEVPPANGAKSAPPIVAAPATTASRYERGMTLPRYWPLGERQGFVTRGQIGPGSDEDQHVGIDVAVPVGTPVRAAGGGVVLDAGADLAYGLFVLIDHPEGYQSMYGHASRIVVSRGDSVQAGRVIALSGNTGRSTAPHLHFEIRRDGRSLDPLTLIQEER